MQQPVYKCLLFDGARVVECAQVVLHERGAFLYVVGVVSHPFVVPCLEVVVAEAQDKASELFNMIGLNDKVNHYPHQLSGGQQQRVALGRALVTRPSIILFDEPLSNLDAILRVTIRNEIKRVGAESKGCVP